MNSVDKLAGLNPAFRAKFERVRRDLDAWLAVHCPGRYVIVTEGKRSLARQLWLYAQGRTRPGKVVTWTMKSKHLDGLAVDIAFGGGQDPYSIDEAAWNYYGHLCRQYGLIWGGDWKVKDKPHCESKGEAGE